MSVTALFLATVQLRGPSHFRLADGLNTKLQLLHRYIFQRDFLPSRVVFMGEVQMFTRVS